MTYQWYRGTKKVNNATVAKYKLKDKDEGKKIKVVMTMTPPATPPWSRR